MVKMIKFCTRNGYGEFLPVDQKLSPKMAGIMSLDPI